MKPMPDYGDFYGWPSNEKEFKGMTAFAQEQIMSTVKQDAERNYKYFWAQRDETAGYTGDDVVRAKLVRQREEYLKLVIADETTYYTWRQKEAAKIEIGRIND